AERRKYMAALAAGIVELKPGEVLRTDYVCERNHAAVDFDPRVMRSRDLALIWFRDRHASRWTSRWIVQPAGSNAVIAASFPVRTGSIGGSEGIQWKAANGQIYTGFLSFSDLIGQFGPDSLWIEQRAGDDRRYPLDKPGTDSRWG